MPGGGTGANQRVRKAGATLPAWHLPKTNLVFLKADLGLAVASTWGVGTGVEGPACSQGMCMHSAGGPLPAPSSQSATKPGASRELSAVPGLWGKRQG